MSDKLKRRVKVQELLFSGYSNEKISEKLGVSTKTIGRDIKWIRQNNKNWLEDLANSGFAQEFRETLEGYKQDIIRLYEMLEQCKDDNTKIKLIKATSDIRYRYSQQFASFPAVWAIDVFVQKNNPHPIEELTLPSLSGISGL